MSHFLTSGMLGFWHNHQLLLEESALLSLSQDQWMCYFLCSFDTNSICAGTTVLHICRSTCLQASVFQFFPLHIVKEEDRNAVCIFVAFHPTLLSILFGIETFPCSCPFLQICQTTNICVNCQLLNSGHGSSSEAVPLLGLLVLSISICAQGQPTSVHQPGNSCGFCLFFFSKSNIWCCLTNEDNWRQQRNNLNSPDHHTKFHKLPPWMLCPQDIHSSFVWKYLNDLSTSQHVYPNEN